MARDLFAVGAGAGLVTAFVVGAAGGFFYRDMQSRPVQKEFYTVARCVDGDTVDVKEGIEVLLARVRLLGIDTPEKGELLYSEATKALEDLIGKNKIKLEKEDKNQIDRYGRPLRYIIVDGKNLNIEMVRLGYAKAFMVEDLAYKDQILAAQEDAQKNKRGIWR